MMLSQHLSQGSQVVIFHETRRTEGTVVAFDTHGVAVLQAGAKFYIPWTAIETMRIDSMPDYDIMDSIA